jgi:hypothetical protein
MRPGLGVIRSWLMANGPGEGEELMLQWVLVEAGYELARVQGRDPAEVSLIEDDPGSLGSL